MATADTSAAGVGRSLGLFSDALIMNDFDLIQMSR